MSKIYFLEIKNKSDEILEDAGKRISEVFSDFFKQEDKVGIKVHFGEEGSTTHLSPIFVKSVYHILKDKVKKTSLVECSVLYKGKRSFASSHKKLAEEHGFTFAPIDFLDGEKGDKDIEIEINKKHFKKVKIGKGIENFNALLAISHFTGHGGTGYGAAVKNIGMGLGSKAGKLEMHKAFNLEVDENLCIGCGSCAEECPSGAISLDTGKAKIDRLKCIGCGKCISECPYDAIKIPWGDESAKELQEKIAEYACGVLKGRKTYFVNVLLDITENCDCFRGKQKPIIPDIGILASDDIVAIDKASLDLVDVDERLTERTGIDGMIQVNYASKLGLGEKEYEIVRL